MNQSLGFGVKLIICCAVSLLIVMGQSDGDENNATERSEASIQLKAEMEKLGSNYENPALLKKLRIEVARSGDVIERKKIRAELKDKDVVRQFEAIEMAKSVGGPDMISGLADLLSDTTGYRSINLSGQFDESRAQGDVVFEPPRLVAAKALSELLGNPPVPPIGKDKKFYTEEDVLTWQRWWQANKAKFQASQ